MSGAKKRARPVAPTSAQPSAVEALQVLRRVPVRALVTQAKSFERQTSGEPPTRAALGQALAVLLRAVAAEQGATS